LQPISKIGRFQTDAMKPRNAAPERASVQSSHRKNTRMKANYAQSLVVFASLGLGAATVQGVDAQSKPSMSEIGMADPGAYPAYVERAQSATINGPDRATAENPATLFRVVIAVRAISSDWNETFAVNPEYPSFEMCEAARGDLVEDFLQILKRQYLQPFDVDSKCVSGDGDV
jgi:hypothetical protein